MSFSINQSVSYSIKGRVHSKVDFVSLIEKGGKFSSVAGGILSHFFLDCPYELLVDWFSPVFSSHSRSLLRSRAEDLSIVSCKYLFRMELNFKN